MHLVRLLDPGKLLLLAASVLLSSAFTLSNGEHATLAALTAGATNDNSKLSTLTSFSVTGTTPGAALFSITDALPGQSVEKDVTITTVGNGDLTLSIVAGSAPGVVAPLNNAAPDDRALMIRVERCGSTFAQASCTGVSGLNGGVTGGVAGGSSLNATNSVTFNAAAAGGPVNLQTAQPSGSYYYKVLLRIPVNTSSGGANSDNTFTAKSVKVTATWQLTSAAGSLRNTP